MSDLKNYDDIKHKINRERELLLKVLKNRYKNKEEPPETFEEFLEECKKYLTKEEYEEYLTLTTGKREIQNDQTQMDT